MRSAPVTTQSTSPDAISEPAAESVITACGTPAASNSHAVTPEPFRRRRGGVEVLAARGGERESVCGCNADGGRAANGKLADRGYQLADGRALQLDDLVREPTLVEEDDPRALLLVPNDVFGV